MSTLTGTEKARLETLFDMSDGYVFGFSDATMGTFFGEEVGIDIHDPKYCRNGTSKAKKMREFWRLENDCCVGELIQALIAEVEAHTNASSCFSPEEIVDKRKLIDQCKTIATRLLTGQINLDHLKQTATTFDAKHLIEQIRRIENSVNDTRHFQNLLRS